MKKRGRGHPSPALFAFRAVSGAPSLTKAPPGSDHQNDTVAENSAVLPAMLAPFRRPFWTEKLGCR